MTKAIRGEPPIHGRRIWLRLGEDLYQSLAEEAQLTERTLAAQIRIILRDWYAMPHPAPVWQTRFNFKNPERSYLLGRV